MFVTTGTPDAVSGVALGALHVVDVDEGTVEQIKAVESVARVDPSADGTTYLIADGHSVRLVTAETFEEQETLTTRRRLSLDPDPWSPTGRWVVARISFRDDGGVLLIDRDRGTQTVIDQGPRGLLGAGWADEDTYLLVDPRANELAALDARTGTITATGLGPSARPRASVTDVSLAGDHGSVLLDTLDTAPAPAGG
ncbi:MAG: hypothetical protein Q4G43_12820 [Mobilicoccus sp.]|nr:hypothetical protein [Mobilicoccus sp.]